MSPKESSFVNHTRGSESMPKVMRNGEPIDLDQFDAPEVDALTRKAHAKLREQGERHVRMRNSSSAQCAPRVWKMGFNPGKFRLQI